MANHPKAKSPKSIVQLLRDHLEALGDTPSYEELEGFVQSAIEHVYEERGKLPELVHWLSAALPPDYPREVRASATTPDQQEELVGGPKYDSWVWSYEGCLAPYLSRLILEDPITKHYRDKHGTLSMGNDSAAIWKHVVALVEKSGVDPKAKNPKLARFYLQLGKSEPKGDSRESIPVPEKPVAELADLLSAVREIAAKYRVYNALAVYAITQDRYQLMHWAYTVRKIEGEAPFRRIVLEVDPKLPAEDVKQIYDAARTKFGWKQKPKSPKNLELAYWAATHPERAWEDLLHSWDLAYWSGSPTAERRPYLPQRPKVDDAMTAEEVEALYAEYHAKHERAFKSFIRDVNDAWRWVFGTEPPKRKMEGKQTANWKAILAQIEEQRRQGESERPMRYRTPMKQREDATNTEQPTKNARKPKKEGESL